MEKFVYYNDLLDLYGILLNENYYQIFVDYYAENLSMQEIADNLQVSKSYIGTVIKNTEKKLENYENKLHLLEKKHRLILLQKENDIEKIKKELEKLI